MTRGRESRPSLATGAASKKNFNLASTVPPSSDLDAVIENASRDWWYVGAMTAVRQLAMAGRGFTVDHVLAMVGQPPDCHYVGVLFAAAQRARVVEAVGARVGADGRLVRIWWGCDPHPEARQLGTAKVGC